MDRTVDLTIAALIFLAGTAGLVSGEDIGGVETTTDIDDESAEAAPIDARYLRGDANDDGSVDLGDFIVMAQYIASDSGPQSIDSRDTKAATKASKTAVAVCDLEPVRVLRGDANGDESVDLGDFIVMVQYILGYGDAPASMQGADINGDHAVNVLDLVMLADHLWGSQCERC